MRGNGISHKENVHGKKLWLFFYCGGGFSTGEGFSSEQDLDSIFFLCCPHLADTAACVHDAEFMYLK